MAYQGSPNTDKFVFASAELFIGATEGTVASVGGLKNTKVEPQTKNGEITLDNRRKIVKKSLDTYKISTEMAEIDLAKFSTIFAGPSDEYTTTAGTIVNNHSYAISSGAWAYDVFIPFDFQNGDGTKITPDSVTASTDGLLVLNTDYFISKDENGLWGIAVRDSATVTTLSQTITIVYDYTPAASKNMKFKSSNFIPDTLFCIIKALDDNGDYLTLKFPAVYSTSFPAFNFPAETGTDVMMTPLELEAVGATYDGDDNVIVYITDERSYS